MRCKSCTHLPLRSPCGPLSNWSLQQITFDTSHVCHLFIWRWIVYEQEKIFNFLIRVLSKYLSASLTQIRANSLSMRMAIDINPTGAEHSNARLLLACKVPKSADNLPEPVFLAWIHISHFPDWRKVNWRKVKWKDLYRQNGEWSFVANYQMPIPPYSGGSSASPWSTRFSPSQRRWLTGLKLHNRKFRNPLTAGTRMDANASERVFF